jgi:hypothetical protein
MLERLILPIGRVWKTPLRGEEKLWGKVALGTRLVASTDLLNKLATMHQGLSNISLSFAPRCASWRFRVDISSGRRRVSRFADFRKRHVFAPTREIPSIV